MPITKLPAASISPSSTRKPRNLTFESELRHAHRQFWQQGLLVQASHELQANSSMKCSVPSFLVLGLSKSFSNFLPCAGLALHAQLHKDFWPGSGETRTRSPVR